MDDGTAEAIMTSTVITIRADASMVDAATAMQDTNIGSLLVIDDDGRPEGILTRSDFVSLVTGAPDFSGESVPRVREWMTTDPMTVAGDTSTEEAAALMRDHAIHHLPVVNDDGEAVGVVTTSDLADTSYEGFSPPE
ncbi:histidine kinase [Halobacteriales archaeon QS_1_68_17]|nr:MAG: histidine kinase [Halobacteriales archaeon QS_1_68_17]